MRRLFVRETPPGSEDGDPPRGALPASRGALRVSRGARRSRLHALLSRAVMPHWSEAQAAASAEDDWLGQAAEQEQRQRTAGADGELGAALLRPSLRELQAVTHLDRKHAAKRML